MAPLVERIATDSRVMRADKIKAGKTIDKEKKLREEEVAMEEMQYKETEEREDEREQGQKRRISNLLKLVLSFLAIAGLWQLWYTLQLGNSLQDYLSEDPGFWWSGSVYVVALLITLIVCAAAAGRVGFVPEVVSTLQFICMTLGVVSSPWAFASRDGWSPLRAMGLTLLDDHPREWPAVVGLIATIGYVIVVMYTRRGDEPVPDGVAKRREAMLQFTALPPLVVLASTAFLASRMDSWQVWLSTASWWALVAVVEIILVWPALNLKGYRTWVPAVIMGAAAFLHIVGQWFSPVQYIFQDIWMGSCSAGFICPGGAFGISSPNGWLSPGDVFSPGGLAILALLLYVVPLYVRWVLTRKKSDV